ncbi:MAG: serine protein kinase RIO [Ignavibacteria bacterium]|nr:serine protein kinase RIO [Ignavibacteria bacterium]
MKITLNNIEETEEGITTFEKFKSKRKKLSPGSQNVRKLTADESSDRSFNSSDLEELRGRGILDELISIIKSGKEASVYLGRCAEDLFAVKIYTDLRVRSFRKDDIYRQGRFIGEARVKKAIDQGSAFGVDAHQILWVQEEFRQMNFLYEAGIPVPKPVACSGLVVMMEFIGEDGIAAERLSDLSLEKDEAEEAFRQSLKIFEAIVSSGRVHGDFSTYNILWHNGKAIAIDFPQVVGLNSNTAAKEILLKDVNSFCKSFKRHKLDPDAGKIYNRLLRMIDY